MISGGQASPDDARIKPDDLAQQLAAVRNLLAWVELTWCGGRVAPLRG
jgi:hypothetical protein